jgi:hypothetical protein
MADAFTGVFGMKLVKSKKCRVCKEPYQPRSPLQRACSPVCALEIAKRTREKSEREAKKVERAEILARKEKIKTRSDWMKDAQHAFNAFIRYRDKDQPCICCGRPLGDGDVGGGYDCGHYRSTGSAPHLRFDERNAHAQRKHCNRWRGGRAVDYRLGLIARIGLTAVEALEADQTERKWTIGQIKEIRDTYRAKLRELKREKGND